MSEDLRTSDASGRSSGPPAAPPGAPGLPPLARLDPGADHPGREPGDLVVALSPRQILGGFALLAALIVMLRRRGRRKV